MIHYTCDRCKREIHTSEHARYVVQIDVQSVDDDLDSEFEDDVDHLAELHALLEEGMPDGRDDEHSHGAEAAAHHRGQYDLCPACYEQFLKNPLGRDRLAALGFSNN